MKVNFNQIIKYSLTDVRKVYSPGFFEGSKILIIGGGYQQYHAIKESINLGFNVYVSDQNTSCPGVSLVNNFWNINSLDKEVLLKNCIREKIDFAFTMQSDLPVPSVAYINDALRSEKLHCDASKNCSRKDLFREALSSSSCLQPNFLIKKDSILTTSDQKKIKEILARYKKIVVKPADSSGSRGVRFLNSFSQEDLTSAIQYALSFSQAGVVVMEGFISGLELGTNLSNNGKCVKVFVHSDVMDPSGRVLAHRYPHPDFTDDQIKKIEYEIAKAVEAIGIQYGPTM